MQSLRSDLTKNYIMKIWMNDDEKLFGVRIPQCVFGFINFAYIFVIFFCPYIRYVNPFLANPLTIYINFMMKSFVLYYAKTLFTYAYGIFTDLEFFQCIFWTNSDVVDYIYPLIFGNTTIQNSIKSAFIYLFNPSRLKVKNINSCQKQISTY